MFFKKNYQAWLVAIGFLLLGLGAMKIKQPSPSTFSTSIEFQPDTLSLLRNPAMGWVMYNEGWELYPYYQETTEHLNVANFWKEMDEVQADSVSTILYIRATWSAFEPEEGVYAWDHDPHFIQLIEGARERHLKLAFRVFHHSGSQVQQATPDYVFEAGAAYSWWDKNQPLGPFKNPYYDDPVFLEKFDKFVAAFAEKFDDSSITDFVDGYGAGLWGEGHGVKVQDSSNMGKAIDQLTGIYERHFNNVLTVYNLSYADWEYADPLVFEKKGFIPRRDGLGSHWYADVSRDRVENYFFPKYPLFAEGCYWLNSKNKDTLSTPYKEDKRFKMGSWKEALVTGMEDALANHANIYDLRVPLEAKFWIEQAPEAVQKFISHSGYRLYPEKVDLEVSDKEIQVSSSWKNLGVGVLPNHHPNWNNKYRLAWALRNNDSGEIEGLNIDFESNPGDWILGEDYGIKNVLKLPETIHLEKYSLVTAIVNTVSGKPELELAMNQSPPDKWYQVYDFKNQ